MKNRYFKRTAKSLAHHLPPLLKGAAISLYLSMRMRRLKSVKTPSSIYVFLTNKCNQKCAHCFYWKETNAADGELALEDIKLLASSLETMADVGLTGGEPFIRDDMAEICKILNDTRKIAHIGIATNGYLTATILEAAREILENCRFIDLRIQISLDGLRQTHDKIRGISGAFDNAVSTFRALEGLKKNHANLKIEFLTTIMRENSNDIIPTIKFCGELKAPIRLHMVRSSRIGTGFIDKDIISDLESPYPQDLFDNIEDFDKVVSDIIEMNNHSSEKFLAKDNELLLIYSMEILKHGNSKIRCISPYAECVVFPNGDISFCETVKPFMNLRKVGFDLRKAWNSEEADTMRARLKKCACAHSCNIQSSLYYNHDLLKKLYV